MNVVKVDLGKYKHKVNLYPIGDVHLGSAHFDRKRLQSLLDLIVNDIDAQVILNGDMINNAIKTSVSDVYTEVLSPQQQLDELVELFTPIKDKIIGVVSGNHEDRTSRLTGIDILKNFCYRLGIEEKYSPIANIIFLSFGQSRGRENSRVTFSIYHSHGTGGGRTLGAKTNAVHRMSGVVHSDIYIHSHTHTPITFKENYIMSYNSSKGIKEVTRLFINTNAYEGFGGYGERMKLTPSNREHICIELSYQGSKKYMNARL
jgi:predicted phosphodiesterase